MSSQILHVMRSVKIAMDRATKRQDLLKTQLRFAKCWRHQLMAPSRRRDPMNHALTEASSINHTSIFYKTVISTDLVDERNVRGHDTTNRANRAEKGGKTIDHVDHVVNADISRCI